ncbi:hypothetical protein [Microcoleus sp. B5-D4]|uniref:hypothetical protein n=1 Tax=Microcoleus sp. B5-D4 TaxID=2818681 RepID=UPI002FD55666
MYTIASCTLPKSRSTIFSLRLSMTYLNAMCYGLAVLGLVMVGGIAGFLVGVCFENFQAVRL